MDHLKEILAGFALLVVALAIIAGFYFTGQSNGQKSQHMNEVCITKGYSGWVTDGCHR